MYLAQVWIPYRPEEVEDMGTVWGAVEHLVRTWRQSNVISESFTIGIWGTSIHVSVLALAPELLEVDQWPASASTCLAECDGLDLSSATVSVDDTCIIDLSVSLEAEEAFFFLPFESTTFPTSPLLGLPSGRPVPLSRLPVSNSFRYDLLSWAGHYRTLHDLFMHGGALEHEALHELSSVTSSISKQGRELAAETEKHLEKPVYYYVNHWYGSRKECRDSGRWLCPGCKRPWRLPTPRPNTCIAYLCNECRLVSDGAVEGTA